jgi:tetratricopeptide (TPR) repeat protein
MTCLAVPNRRVVAQETWQACVPLLLTYDAKKHIVDMFLTCTYEGIRDKEGQKYAVISLSGYIKGRKSGRQSAAGTVTGKVHFALDDGYLSLANIKVESEGEDNDISVAHSLELTMARVPGNTAGIVARPVAPVPGPRRATNADYELAIPHFQKRDFDQAIPLLEKAIAANPNLVPALNDLGFAYNEKRLYDKAIPCFKKLIALQPSHVTAHNNLGAAYNGKGLYDEAIPCFRKAIALDPDHAVAHSNLGFAYSAKRLFDQAIPCFEKAIELDPQNVAAHINLGIAYNEERLHDQAIPCFKRAIEFDGKNVAAHNYLGFAYNAKGLYDDAIPCFKKVLELDPKHAAALHNLGFAYNAQGLYDQGIPWLKKTIELHPKHAIAYAHLGTALGEVGDLEQARDVLKKALALTSATAPQFKSWKQILEQMETLLRLESGLATIVKGERKPKSFLEGLQFGKLCRVKKHYRAAIRFYEQAYANDPVAAKKVAPINLLIFARTALLASAGRGSDPPPEAKRPKYRAKALALLQKFAKTQNDVLEKNFNASRYSCQINIRVLLQHKDLASARPPALNNFPEGERKEWEAFWNEVDTLLEKADALMPDPSAADNP